MARTWFRRRRTAGRLGLVGVTRLLAFQGILVGLLLLVLPAGTTVALLAGGGGAVAVAVTFGRWRGRWWTEVAALWLGYRRHGRGVAAAPPPAGDPRLVALRELVPDLVVEDVPGTVLGTYGMGSDGAGWFTVFEVETSDTGVHPPVPLAALARVAADAGQPGVVTQVVAHAAGPHRTLWVAVRLDAEAVAESSVDSQTGPPDVPAVLAEIARRAGRALRRRGLTARVLDTDGLLDALVRSCDLGAADAGPPGSRETWQAWRSVRLAHRCFWLRTWPEAEHAVGLLASLYDLPGAEVSVALLLEPGPDGEETDLRCLLRLATAPEAYRPAGDQVGHLAGRLGGSMFPLDGEHALATYATAPSGGGAR